MLTETHIGDLFRLTAFPPTFVLMVKERIPTFVRNSGALIEATRMAPTPREGYVMSSHCPLEEQDTGSLPEP